MFSRLVMASAHRHGALPHADTVTLDLAKTGYSAFRSASILPDLRWFPVDQRLDPWAKRPGLLHQRSGLAGLALDARDLFGQGREPSARRGTPAHHDVVVDLASRTVIEFIQHADCP